MSVKRLIKKSYFELSTAKALHSVFVRYIIKASIQYFPATRGKQNEKNK